MAPKKWKRKPGGFGRLRRLPSGKFQASYTSPKVNLDGKAEIIKAPSTFLTEDQAEHWLATEKHRIVVAEISGEKWKSPTEEAKRSMTVGELVEDWLTNADIRQQTRVSYRSSLKLRVAQNKIANENFVAVDRERIRQWYAEISAQSGDLVMACELAAKHLHKAFNFAVDREWIEVNPVRMSDLLKKKDEEDEDDDKPVISLEQAQGIAEGFDDSLKVPVLVMFWGALRFGEMAALTRESFLDDGETMTVRIRKSVYLVKDEITGKWNSVSSKPKTKAGRRDVVLPKKIAEQVRIHLDKYVGKEPTALFATRSNGAQLYSRNFNYHFKKAARAVGRDDVSCHDARHFGITVLVNHGGIKIKDISKMVGHTRIEETLNYLQHEEDYGLTAAANLDKIVP